MLYLTQRDDWHVIFTAMIWQNDLNTVLGLFINVVEVQASSLYIYFHNSVS